MPLANDIFKKQAIQIHPISTSSYGQWKGKCRRECDRCRHTTKEDQEQVRNVRRIAHGLVDDIIHAEPKGHTGVKIEEVSTGEGTDVESQSGENQGFSAPTRD